MPLLASNKNKNKERPVPTISSFYGILIQMYWRDHAPPHFHAIYAEHDIAIEIQSLKPLHGKLPRRALALVLEWAEEHRDELMENWQLCARGMAPRKVQPLG
jgi:hypothetical protein